jgi:hypothetical protein
LLLSRVKREGNLIHTITKNKTQNRAESPQR